MGSLPALGFSSALVAILALVVCRDARRCVSGYRLVRSVWIPAGAATSWDASLLRDVGTSCSLLGCVTVSCAEYLAEGIGRHTNVKFSARSSPLDGRTGGCERLVSFCVPWHSPHRVSVLKRVSRSDSRFRSARNARGPPERASICPK